MASNDGKVKRFFRPLDRMVESTAVHARDSSMARENFNDLLAFVTVRAKGALPAPRPSSGYRSRH
jgi:hypothetical protein